MTPGSRTPRPSRGPGLSDDEPVELGRTVSVTRGVASGVHAPWMTYVTERPGARGVSGTPTVFVAGIAVPADTGAIEAAVMASGSTTTRY